VLPNPEVSDPVVPPSVPTPVVVPRIELPVVVLPVQGLKEVVGAVVVESTPGV
jgi:hypothetical protein